MFSPKKSKISKKDLKKSIVNTNDRLKAVNARMELEIEAGKGKLKNIERDYDSYKKALEDTKDMQVFANNELESTQFEIAEAQTALKKVLSKVASLSEEAISREASSAKLQSKSDKLTKNIVLLKKRKEELDLLTADLRQIRQEAASGQETLELLAIDLNELEAGVEAYASRKSAAESEFNALKAKIERDKRIAIEGLREIEDCGKRIKFENGSEMGRLDHAIADRMSELKDMEEMKRIKEYELSTILSRVSSVESRVNDAEERVEIAAKKEQEKISKIKGDFKDWKITALDEVARLKIKGKLQNIEKAGLKDVLDG